jgi:2-(1,2-epoxy-1,2-dihydrophenyl)acetyl-CoA isomerase
MTAVQTGTDELLVDLADGVATVTLNRPERRNALTDPMLESLAQVIADAHVNDDVRCFILTGAGGAFCSGGDVKAMRERNADNVDMSSEAAIHRHRLLQRRITGALWSLPKPTLAVLPGATAGAGLSLALACDLRYASRTAVLTTAFGRVGLSGDYGGSWFLTQLVGVAKAKELYFLSARLTAEQAHGLGIVNAVLPEEELRTATAGIARELAAGPALAYRYMKQNLNRAVGGSLEDCLDLEVANHGYSRASADHREAAQAFVEHRSPVFRAR